MNHKGFTLIELVMVITVTSILALTAIPAFYNSGSAISEGAARKLAGDLSLARKLARNRNGVYGITFDAVNNTYTVHSFDPATGTTTTATDPLTLSPMVVDFATLPGLTGTDIQNPNFGGTSTIRFNSQGIPQTGTGAALAAAGSLSVASGYQSHVVTVQPNTGAVDF